jgi:phage shock protein PspC (stress-responsive transcriptional regulator)
MAQNSEYWQYERLERVTGRFHGRVNQMRGRVKVRRSPNGLVLGVFRGIAESRGYSVFWTRVIGSTLLVFLSGGSLLAAGFFYLLAAVLMRSSAAEQPVLADWRPVTVPAVRMVAASGREIVSGAPRVDFTVLDRQLDGLDRRIQSLEGIVTDRHYDWDRRLES